MNPAQGALPSGAHGRSDGFPGARLRAVKERSAEGSHLVFISGKDAKCPQFILLTQTVGQVVLPVLAAADDQAATRAAVP